MYRLQRVQFCPQGELAFAPPFSFQLDFEEGLSLSTIHDFDEIQARRGTDDAICLNAARVPIPPGRVPAGRTRALITDLACCSDV